jgi:DNA-binding MarR family transcriptional regulator
MPQLLYQRAWIGIMKKSKVKDKDYELWVLLAQTRESMFKARKKELHRYGLHPRQAAVLYTIHFLGDMATPAEVSRWLLREPHTISTLLNKMEGQGLVKKTKDLDRKNVIRLSLTEEGIKSYQKILKRNSMHKIMACLSEEEKRKLWSHLERIRARSLRFIRANTKPPFPPKQEA